MFKTKKAKDAPRREPAAKAKRTKTKSTKTKPAAKAVPRSATKPKKAVIAKVRQPAAREKHGVLSDGLVRKPITAVSGVEAEKIISAPKVKEVEPKKIPQPPKEPVRVHREARQLAKEKGLPVAHKALPPQAEVKVERPETSRQAEAEPEAASLKELEVSFPLTVKDLAVKLQEKPSLLIKALMNMGVMSGINQSLEETTINKICQKYGYRIKQAPDEEESALLIHQHKDLPGELKSRSPIVTLMGHVDHGKTSLLDAIRKTKIAESEHGGITQHIGAYRVVLPRGEITFLDTPGHEAFTAMRARGASVTDIVVLVVAADDGVMPQTEEAIDHARAAGVPIIVSVNKVDKPQANVDRVKKQLSQLNLMAEDWGGKTITVPVSAKTGQGIDNLLEMILLEAEMLELKANPNKPSRGVVIEAKMSKGRGPVVTLLVQNGTLHLNENIIVGNYYGKIRAMFNDLGHPVTEARPSFAVEVLGVSGIPDAGEQFYAIKDERQARELAAMRLERDKQRQIKSVKRISLEDLHSQIEEGKIKELKLIIKADVQGSLEAIKDTLAKLNVTEIKLDIIHSGVGNINTSDVILAVASNALILGFNVVCDDPSKELLAKEGVEAKIYNIIYELANEIKAAIEGMLEPRLKKVFLGRVEVRKVFKLSRAGTVAGCFVTKGKFNRSCVINVVRNGEVVFEGKVSSLKRFKDDVREVAEGFECGMTVAGFEQLMEGDIIEAYEKEKIARRIE